MPKVSVVVPTFNSAKYIREALLSILVQDYHDYEIIVVDDASTDDTAEVVKDLNSDKINYLRLPENHGGPSKPRNIGVKNALGEYIAFFDSDDLMLPGRLAKGATFLDEYTDIGMVFTDAYKFDQFSGDHPDSFLQNYIKFKRAEKKQIDKDRYIINIPHAHLCLFYENFVLPSSVTVRREVFQKTGYFDESLTNGDDRDMWFRIFRSFPIGYIDFQSFKYRLSQGSISRRGAILAENRIKVLRKQLLFHLPDSEIKQTHKLISQNYYGIGYHYRQQGNLKKAREFFINSLQERLCWTSIKGYLITFLGSTILNKLTTR